MTQDRFIRELAPLVHAALATGPLTVSALHQHLRQLARRIPPRHLLATHCAQLPDVRIDRAVDHQACRISARIQLVDHTLHPVGVQS